MCGRYAASRRPEDLAGIFEIEKWEPEETLAPDFNVAPTKEVYAVLDRPVKDADDRRPVRQLRSLLEPPPTGLMRADPVSTAVSNVRNNGPELLKELEGPEEGTLF